MLALEEAFDIEFPEDLLEGPIFESLSTMETAISGLVDQRRTCVTPTEVAVVGLGPWGLATVERLVTVAGRRQTPLVIHVIEPGVPGAGIFCRRRSRLPASQHALRPARDVPEPSTTARYPATPRACTPGRSEQGYRWVGDQCRKVRLGKPITPDDFLPQRLMGEWLHWSYTQLVESLPPWVSVHHHKTRATDVEPTADNRELVRLASGETRRRSTTWC